MSNLNNTQVTPRTLYRILSTTVPQKIPTMIWGAPGIGKSDIARHVAKSLSMNYHDIRALLLDPVDLRGIPWKDQADQTRWAPPAFLPPTNSKEGHLINLEELPNAPQMTQAALYQLVLDRQIGEYHLPDNAALIACGNRMNDHGGTNIMPAPLRKRFVHLELTTDIEEWIEWASDNDIEMDIMEYLWINPDALNDDQDDDHHSGAPNPRAWWRASQILQAAKNGSALEKPDIQPLLSGTIGKAATLEFKHYLKQKAKAPSPKTIFGSPGTAPIPEDPAITIALCGRLAKITADEKDKTKREKLFEAMVIFTNRLDNEFGFFTIKQAVRINRQLKSTQTYIKWIADNEGSKNA